MVKVHGEEYRPISAKERQKEGSRIGAHHKNKPGCKDSGVVRGHRVWSGDFYTKCAKCGDILYE